PSLTLPPAFVNNVDLPLSAGLLNMLLRAAIALDGWSYRRLDCTDSLAQWDTIAWNRGHTTGDRRIWAGAAQKLSGNTTLTVEGFAGTVTPGSTIKVYLNGSSTAAATITPSSSWSGSCALASINTGDIFTIDVRTSGNLLTNSQYIVRDVYTSPLTFATSWPGVPTF